MFFHGNHDDLTQAIEAIGAGFAVYEDSPEDEDFVLISCNDLYEELIGKNKNKTFGLGVLSVFPRYIAKPMIDTFYQCKSEQVAVESEIIIKYKGLERYWRSITSPIVDSKHDKLRIIQTCVEITEKKVLEKKLLLNMKRYEAVFQSAHDGIITIDSHQHIKLMNQAATQMFGYQLHEMAGQSLTKLIPQKYRSKHKEYVNGFKNSPTDSRPMQTRTTVLGLRNDGSEFPVEITISKIQVKENIELTAVIRDVSKKNALMEELIVAAHEDPLTKLFNRRYFTELLNKEILRFKRFKQKFSLLMLDIDHFKKVNDAYGHASGDITLKELANTLKETVREVDILGRWGGEEFLIILPETHLLKAIEVAEKVRVAIGNTKIDTKVAEINLSVSIGVQEYGDGDIALDDFVNNVDKCLYIAKKKGRNRVCSKIDI